MKKLLCVCFIWFTTVLYAQSSSELIDIILDNAIVLVKQANNGNIDIITFDNKQITSKTYNSHEPQKSKNKEFLELEKEVLPYIFTPSDNLTETQKQKISLYNKEIFTITLHNQSNVISQKRPFDVRKMKVYKQTLRNLGLINHYENVLNHQDKYWEIYYGKQLQPVNKYKSKVVINKFGKKINVDDLPEEVDFSPDNDLQYFDIISKKLTLSHSKIKLINQLKSNIPANFFNQVELYKKNHCEKKYSCSNVVTTPKGEIEDSVYDLYIDGNHRFFGYVRQINTYPMAYQKLINRLIKKQ